ncbi:glutamine amidotransferase [Candidatus Kinetoplastibacterium blastocrithidii TCC012E]|uniref:Imidazole glycerol phosphate synthase subunit HisH n=1 Tax=Candidatus Kinetoplastidibacterium blastocrithidiae TCC012E TaxID=1208922 RepID=M1LAD9_9PROT|nr:imidazole glycerol phosphate synthase subunit HisH [Candidatus Kinetoplastibacterium blastocrithidii]AFZ83375.1 imidazole glycerol phosphate synthase, glutamine amidotransferase subunit 1 [Candidatus Kinetoplastibacterium blastocrithidii (ex Strigomonas culicis)]AGF49473.1 glutamine amidotransferase [Candidatus Kinetoplastibacterium blastocrithidii TCC012E]
MSNIAIIDFGMGNLHSVARAMQYAAPEANIKICSSTEEIKRADKLVLPGQGAMLDSMKNLEKLGLIELIKNTISEKPMLGICVGEQMLFDYSLENGHVKCLGLLRGSVKQFSGYPFVNASNSEEKINANSLKVPHMGWNRVHQKQDHFLWKDIPNNTHFYFVHSYYVCPEDETIIAGETDYGLSFTCAIASDNIFAVQFHPEKSSKYGLMLYRNFANWKV